MDIETVTQVWELMLPHVQSTDVKYAADDLLQALVDNGHEITEIKESFRGDSAMMGAIRGYDQTCDPDEYDDDDWCED